MEAINGVSDGGGPPPPSPLTGCYLLIVIGEPHSQEHKDIILRRVAKGLLSWDLSDCMVDLEKELAIITEQAPEGEEARYGERLIQYASENLVTEILIHPAVSTLSQCVRNLLSSFTRHRHIIHSGYTFAANGSWALQDGTFSLADFSEAFQELEVQRVIRAYDNGISVDMHCSSEGDWARLPKEPFTKNCKVRLNPVDVLLSSSPAIADFLNYIAPFLVPLDIVTALESSEVVGNIRFSHPTLYVFPGGQGDAALFGINGFNMLLDGGFSRKACFWDFVRHLDRLDAVLLTRLNNSNVSGILSVLKRKRQNAVYPQIGHFFCNIQERKALLSPDGDKDRDPLLINLMDEGQAIVTNLKHLNLHPQACYRDSEPINLYHKVGHGTLDMYVLSPGKDSREVREFVQKWNSNDNRLFANPKNKEFSFPLPNLVSICALLVWQPSNASENITRILFPGSTPQNKIFEGLDRLKQLDCIKYPICSEITLNPPKKTKEHIFDSSKPQKILPEVKKEKSPRLNDLKPKEHKDAAKQQDNKTSDIPDVKKEIKKSDSTDSDKSATKLNNKTDAKSIKDAKEAAVVSKAPRVRDKDSRSVERKAAAKTEKKISPTTPKKAIANGDAAKPKAKVSPTATPAKSAKEATNRKVLESKKQVPKEKKDPKSADKKAEPEKKVERKPISRRPKPAAAPATVKPTTGSPIRKKPESIAKKAKLDKEGTTDSSTVSTPTADGDLKRDISKLTPEELDQLKAQELADLQEEQEVVQEIEAVFRKGEELEASESEMRKIKNISMEEKTEEEYLVVEKVEVQETEEVQEVQEEEIQKLIRDSEESEKQRKLSDPKADAAKEIISPEEKVDKVESGTQPDEKFSATVESGATTAPTLPEDERIPLDEIKEKDDIQVIEEKHVKEETKEKESVPVIHLPSKSIDSTPPAKPAPVVGIRLDKQQHIRDIVKTPDEVADLPVHEVADHYADYQKNTDEQTTMIVKETLQDAKADVQKGIQEVKDEVKAVVDEITDDSKNIVDKEVIVDAVVTSAPVVEVVIENVAKETDEVVEDTPSELKKTAVDIGSVVKEEIAEIREIVTEETERVTDDALKNIQVESTELHGDTMKEVEEIKETTCTIKQTTAELSQVMEDAVVEIKETIERVIEETVETITDAAEKADNEESKEDLLEKAEDSIKLDQAQIEDHKSTVLNDSHELVHIVKDVELPKHTDDTKSPANETVDAASENVVTEETKKIKENIQEKIDEVQSVDVMEVAEKKESIDNVATIKSTLSDKVNDIKENVETSIAEIATAGEATIAEAIDKKDQVASAAADFVAKEVAAGNEFLEDLEKTVEITATSSVTSTNDIKEQLESAVRDEVESSVTKITDSITQGATSAKTSVTELINKTTDEIKKDGDEVISSTTTSIEQETAAKLREIDTTLKDKTDSITGFLSKGLTQLEEATKSISDIVIDGVEKALEEIKISNKTGEELSEVDEPDDAKESETHETSIVVQNVDEDLPQVINLEGSLESPCQTPFDFIDKVDLGRKSPKEREEDVAKIVASVAEVLKSEAPLEDFKGKIPLEIAPFPTFTPFTTELRETHITTVDSPTTDFPGQITPIKEEKMDEVLKEMKDDIDSNSNKSKINELIQTSNELLAASSIMISGIKERKEEKITEEDEGEELEEAVDTGTVHRMLVTASSEDGGEETVICPPGSITFPKSSESSGRSSPDYRKDDNQKPEQSSPESSQDAPSVLQKEPEISAKMKSEDIPETKDKIDRDERKTSIPIDPDNKATETVLELEVSRKSSSDKVVTQDSNKDEDKSGKSTPDIAKSGAATPDMNNSDKVTTDIQTSSNISKTDKALDKVINTECESTLDNIVLDQDATQNLASSGKSTPDVSKSDKVSPDIPKSGKEIITKSGTSTPEIAKDEIIDVVKSEKVTTDISNSGIHTSDITKEVTNSGKSTPNIAKSGAATPDIAKDTVSGDGKSGKTTPDIIQSGTVTPDTAKAENTSDIPKSGKATPDIAKSGTVTPDLGADAAVEVSKSGKSTPDIDKSRKLNSGTPKSGTATPDLTDDVAKSETEIPDIKKDNLSEKVDKAGQVIPDIAKSGTTAPDVAMEDVAVDSTKSVKETPDIVKSGKVTPDVKSDLDADILKSDKTIPNTGKSDTTSLAKDDEVAVTKKSYQSTADINKSEIATPDSKPVLATDISISTEITPDIATTGTTTPDITKDNAMAGISKTDKPTPDIPQSEAPDIPLTGKSTPDVSESRKDAIDNLESGKSTPEIQKSGKATPDRILSEIPQSGAKAPDTSHDEHDPEPLKAVTPKDDDVEILDDKSKLVLSGDTTPVIAAVDSGKSTLDLPDTTEEDLAINGKISPETITSLPSTVIEDSKSTSVTESHIESHMEETQERGVVETSSVSESFTVTCCARVDDQTSTVVANQLTDDPHSEKSTPDVNNISGKSSPDVHQQAELDKRGSTQIEKSPALSGKATPDVSKSGISSPDFGKGDSIKLDTDSLASGKATPDINIDLPSSVAPHSVQMDTDSLASDKIAPDFKHDLSSGKATPELDKQSAQIETDSLGSGKVTPDSHKIDVLSGKSTPDVCKRDSLVVEKTSSGKSTPDSNKDEASSKKSSIQVDDNIQISGKSTPDMSKSAKSAVDTKDDSLHIEDCTHSGKSTPDLHKAKDDKVPSGEQMTTELKSTAVSDSRKSSIPINDGTSGKSTPDLDEPISSRKGSRDVGEVHKLDKIESAAIKDEILTERKDSLRITSDKIASGKSSPEIVDKSDKPTMVTSGKSTPDTAESNKDSTHIDAISNADTVGTMTIDSGFSEKSTSEKHKDEKPDLDSQKRDSLVALSGKTTPEPLQGNVASGKSTPISPDHQNGVSRDSIASGKSTPGLSGKITPEPDISSGKVTPEPDVDVKIDAKDLKEGMKILSGKSTPDSGCNTSCAATTTTIQSSVVTMAETLKQEIKTHSFSGTQSPDFSKRGSIQAEHILPGKSTPDGSKQMHHDDSDKSTSEFGKRGSIQAEHILSGKSTPDFGKMDAATTKKDSLPMSGQSTPLLGKASPDVHLSDVQGKFSDTLTEVSTSFDMTQLQSAHVFRELMKETITSSFEEKKSQNGDVIHEKHEMSNLETVKETISGKSTPELVKDSRKSSVMSGGDDSDYRKFSITSENTKTSSVMSGKSTPERKEDNYAVQAFLDAERQLEGTSSTTKSEGKSSHGDVMSTPAFQADPMSTSFYGALPDDSDGEDLEHLPRRKEPDLMTSSFIGDLPTDDKTEEEVKRWGKPLGLPSPAPPSDNKGTPKKEKRLPMNVSVKNKLNQRSESPSKKRKMHPIYVDLTYVPHHGNSYYSQVDFFKRVRARYYVFSGIEPSKDVYNALLEAKQTWEDKDLEVTIIPTYDTDVLGYWVAENEELLTKYKIDLSPSASRCTINLQDHETSCSAYRLEF